jgi:hypothetical protein
MYAKNHSRELEYVPVEMNQHHAAEPVFHLRSENGVEVSLSHCMSESDVLMFAGQRLGVLAGETRQRDARLEM